MDLREASLTGNLAGKVQIDFPNSSHHLILHKDWLSKRRWCEEQGWTMNEDFWAPGVFDGPWWFRDARHMTLFALKWSS